MKAVLLWTAWAVTLLAIGLSIFSAIRPPMIWSRVRSWNSAGTGYQVQSPSLILTNQRLALSASVGQLAAVRAAALPTAEQVSWGWRNQPGMTLGRWWQLPRKEVLSTGTEGPFFIHGAAGGFRASWYHAPGGWPVTVVVIALPLWCFMLTGPVATVVWSGPELATTACEQCGYDLRATPGRCPECGLVEGE